MNADDAVLDDAYRTREAIVRLGRAIAEQKVRGRSSDGLVVATAIATGNIVGLEIDPRVFRRPDSQGLAASVLEAVNAALVEAGRVQLDGLAAATGSDFGTLGDVTRNAHAFAEETFAEVERMRAERR